LINLSFVKLRINSGLRVTASLLCEEIVRCLRMTNTSCFEGRKRKSVTLQQATGTTAIERSREHEATR
jgi:hypothetical protein